MSHPAGPIVTLIAALTRNRVIGRDNGMPWHLPDDLRHFQRRTLNKPVLMGRRTFESIGGRPLPRRRNLVLTRDPAFRAEGCEVAASMEEALATCAGEPELMVMGGAQVYAQWLARADRLELTEIDAELAGDAYFPEWDPEAWREVARERHEADERHAYAYAFITLERI